MRLFSRFPLARAPLWLGLLSAALAAAPSCTPKLGDDPPPAYFEFDPTTNPPRVPLPNVAAVNQETGLIDLGVPYDLSICEQITSMPPAMCEFSLYLEGLDGYPTQSPITVPVSAELDLTTLTPENLAVFALAPLHDLELSWDATNMNLVIENPDGFKVGQQYVVAIRGYDDGVRTTDGTRVVAPTAYSLIKREESLINCHPDPPDPQDLVDPVVDHDCKYYVLMAEQYHATDAETIAAVEQSLIDLETLRQGFLTAGLWDAVDLLASMPKEEVAMVFAFPTHSGPVVEIDPDRGKIPTLVPPNSLRLEVNGTLDASTLVPGAPLSPTGTVGLLNVTALAANDYVNGLPQFDVAFVDGAIEIQDATPLIPGDRYVILLRTEDPIGHATGPYVADTDGNPLVPPPAVVAIRGRYPVYDDVLGVSNISTFSVAQAQELEVNRVALGELLDNPAFTLTREQIGYLFAFDLPTQ